MKIHTFRTRFAKDIVAEFLPPKNLKSNKVVIFCGGMPGYNSKGHLLRMFAQKGYWAFSFHYRGSWESDGKFLKLSPAKDVLDIMATLPKGFVDIWSKKPYRVKPEKIVIIGSSFGGPAALFASLDPRVTKVIVVSSVVDW